ncbi:MAG: phenylacetate-CoA oxygenase subunit PaaC [Actinomycetota bacterium]|nr:phenylacetate-CoA oxygenase subunit PaaC [Actinomycetota bacterium]
MNDSLVGLLVALGDDELILGHRHSEWTGHAPHIEEDVAFSSIAQDEIGHASALYALAAEITGNEADRLALGRRPEEYRHAILCERPNQDWAFTLARHWLYDSADAVRLEALEETTHDGLAALVRKIRREERYHLLHADTWIKRVAGGPVEGRAKLVAAMTEARALARGLFEPFEQEDELNAEGWLPVPSEELEKRFDERAGEALEVLGLHAPRAAAETRAAEFVASSSGDLIADDESLGQPHHPASKAGGLGGRMGKHSPEFAQLHEEMTAQYQGHPGATW